MATAASPGQDGLVVDLFAGAGGWSEALKAAHFPTIGIELDERASQTARAAGHTRLQTDVAGMTLGTAMFGMPVVGITGSPPCQPYSYSGLRLGVKDQGTAIAAAQAIALGDPRAIARSRSNLRDPRSLLVLEPLRWTLALRPRWFAFEQVRAVLPLWEHFAALLEATGYSCATGLMSAEQYGVPQSRMRALLVGSLTAPVALPSPERQAYDARRAAGDGSGLPRWISAGEALGLSEVGTLYTNNQTGRGRKHRPRGGVRSLAAPAYTLDTASHSWTLSPHRVAVTQAGHHGRRPLVTPSRTTAALSSQARREAGERRITASQAGVLQGFRPDYPWQGSKTEQFRQIGNAIPPGLAAAAIRAATAASQATARRSA